MQDNDAKRLRGLTKSANEKKRHFHTRTMNQIDMQETIDMLGRHLLNFARLSSVWHEFSSRNPDENWRRREKSKGLGGQNTHKKLSPEQLSLYLAYNMPPRLHYRSPPSAILSWHSVHRCGGAHCVKNTTPDSKEVTTTKEGG